jgi:hypothetical protein
MRPILCKFYIVTMHDMYALNFQMYNGWSLEPELQPLSPPQKVVRMLLYIWSIGLNDSTPPSLKNMINFV